MYIMKYTYQIYKETKMKMYGLTGNSRERERERERESLNKSDLNFDELVILTLSTCSKYNNIRFIT